MSQILAQASDYCILRTSFEWRLLTPTFKLKSSKLTHELHLDAKIQARVEAISERMESVQETFPAVTSCSGLASLEGAAGGISEAKDAIDGETKIILKK